MRQTQQKGEFLVNTKSEDSKVDGRVESEPRCDKSFIQKEMKDAMKRVEKILRDSKVALSDAIEEGTISAKRRLRRVRAAADGYLDDATHQVRGNPWAAVGLAFGAGALVGGLLLLASRGGNKLQAPGTSKE
jgi:ElaB/YqjD/DUF883 family membrane-anchored ribosome-binding protein